MRRQRHTSWVSSDPFCWPLGLPTHGPERNDATQSLGYQKVPTFRLETAALYLLQVLLVTNGEAERWLKMILKTIY